MMFVTPTVLAEIVYLRAYYNRHQASALKYVNTMVGGNVFIQCDKLSDIQSLWKQGSSFLRFVKQRMPPQRDAA